MPRVDDYKAAIALAVAELKKVNPQRLCNLSRCEYFYDDTREWLIVPFFGQGRMVSWPEVSVTYVQGEGDISLTEQILILHYLLNASGEPLSGREIDFRNVPETFGSDLDLYREVAATLGGTPRDLGDASATFMAFPLVPVTHVLWQGDEEFPPEASILFDDTISSHLSTEDVAALAGSSVYRLMGAAYKMRKSH